jgi:23S rRNA (cytidine1920-2'-O)/16S rRNA (cytidine1409-2'-O)-methyltransferase
MSDKAEKKRLDVILTERGYFSSREKAQAAVMAGLVSIDNNSQLKSGTQYRDDDELVIVVEDTSQNFVSRGGLKLEKALSTWNIDLTGKVCMDVGASTGGFTDVMLRAGAAEVYAIDVGYGQLDYKLRNDKRVINMERVNFRYFDKNTIENIPEFISVDVSFISLKHIFPVAADILSKDGRMIALIKPQFEAGREQVGKNGIVRDQKVRDLVIENIKKYAVDNGLEMQEIIESPITGAKGNIEYLGLFCLR